MYNHALHVSCKVARLLLHTETPDGNVVPIWEEVSPHDVLSPRDVMASRCLLDGHVEVNYARIPITAERPPDYSDITELMDVVVKNSSSETPIVVNCQLGRGRSTLTAVRVVSRLWARYVLTFRWLL